MSPKTPSPEDLAHVEGVAASRVREETQRRRRAGAQLGEVGVLAQVPRHVFEGGARAAGELGQLRAGFAPFGGGRPDQDQEPGPPLGVRSALEDIGERVYEDPDAHGAPWAEVGVGPPPWDGR